LDESRRNVRFECRDSIGHPIWRRDYCDAHTKPLIAKARALGIDEFWHEREVRRLK